VQAGAIDPCGVEVSPAVQSLVSLVSSTSSLSSSSALSKSRIEAGIEGFPSWMKRYQACAVLSRFAGASSRLVKKVNTVHYRAKHVAAHKTATLAMKTPESAKGKHGMGIRSVVLRINNEMLTLPGDRKLSVCTVH
jgi:hypothetical protein